MDKKKVLSQSHQSPEKSLNVGHVPDLVGGNGHSQDALKGSSSMSGDSDASALFLLIIMMTRISCSRKQRCQQFPSQAWMKSAGSRRQLPHHRPPTVQSLFRNLIILITITLILLASLGIGSRRMFSLHVSPSANFSTPYLIAASLQPSHH